MTQRAILRTFQKNKVYKVVKTISKGVKEDMNTLEYSLRRKKIDYIVETRTHWYAGSAKLLLEEIPQEDLAILKDFIIVIESIVRFIT